MSRALDTVHHAFQEGADLRLRFAEAMGDRLVSAADHILDSLTAGGKLLIFGNGGSASDAQHIAAEFVNRYVGERPALAAIALTTDSSALTSIGNDRSFEELFSRQVDALARSGDVALAITTSGNSPNVLRAVESCRRLGVFTIGLTGGGGGKLATEVDLLIDVADSRVTARIQEIHITAAHVLCELVDAALAERVAQHHADP